MLTPRILSEAGKSASPSSSVMAHGASHLTGHLSNFVGVTLGVRTAPAAGSLGMFAGSFRLPADRRGIRLIAVPPRPEDCDGSERFGFEPHC